MNILAEEGIRLVLREGKVGSQFPFYFTDRTRAAEGTRLRSEPIWNELLGLGCDRGQGYFLGPPMAADRIERLVCAAAEIAHNEEPSGKSRDPSSAGARRAVQEIARNPSAPTVAGAEGGLV